MGVWLRVYLPLCKGPESQNAAPGFVDVSDGRFTHDVAADVFCHVSFDDLRPGLCELIYCILSFHNMLSLLVSSAALLAPAARIASRPASPARPRP